MEGSEPGAKVPFLEISASHDSEQLSSKSCKSKRFRCAGCRTKASKILMLARTLEVSRRCRVREPGGIVGLIGLGCNISGLDQSSGFRPRLSEGLRGSTVPV